MKKQWIVTLILALALLLAKGSSLVFAARGAETTTRQAQTSTPALEPGDDQGGRITTTPTALPTFQATDDRGGHGLDDRQSPTAQPTLLATDDRGGHGLDDGSLHHNEPGDDHGRHGRDD